MKEDEGISEYFKCRPAIRLLPGLFDWLKVQMFLQSFLSGRFPQ